MPRRDLPGGSASRSGESVRLVWRPHGNGWLYWIGGTPRYAAFMAKYGYWVPEERA